MPTLNLQLFSIAYSDTTVSNNPQIRNFDISYKLLGQTVNNPRSNDFSIAPGAQQQIFSGIRTTSLDNTTAFTVSQPYPAIPSTYRFTNSGGTAPAFRTARAIGVDNTSSIQVTINGPIATYTSIGGTLMSTSSVVVGDVLKIDMGAGFSQSNQGRFTILAKSATSISVQNPNAILETVTVLDYTQFLVYSNGGGTSNQVQIGDKVVISAGFSQVDWGTYAVSEVTPGYFELNTLPPDGIPIETNIIPTTAGLVFYSVAKSFILIAAQQSCTLQINGDTSGNIMLQPPVPDVPSTPALYMQSGLIYSLSVTNTSLEQLSIQICSAE